MKINYLVYFLFLLLLGCSINNSSNFLEDKVENIFSVSSFHILSDDLVEYDIRLSVYNRDLIFKKNNNLFTSKLSFHVKIIDQNNGVIYNDAWSENYQLKYYEDTQSSDRIFIDRKLFLQEGEFELYISIDDYENNKHWNIKKNLEFQFNDNIQLSDMAILYREDKELRYLFENQFVEDLDTLWVKYQIIDNEQKNDTLKCIISSLPANSSNAYDAGKFHKEILFVYDGLRQQEVNIIPVPLHDVNSDYVYINIYYKDIIKSRSVKIANQVFEEVDYFELIGPMEYVLDYSEYLDFLELDESSQIDFVEDFWSKRYNKELFNEFIKRVKYSEVNFSLFLEGGWESDRGRIYIKYGEPIDVSFEFNQRGEFEIWTYQNNRRFIFKNNLGMYELYDSTY